MFDTRGHLQFSNLPPTIPTIRWFFISIQKAVNHGGNPRFLRLGKPHPVVLSIEVNCAKSQGKTLQIGTKQYIESVYVPTAIANEISNTRILQIKTHISIYVGFKARGISVHQL